MSNALAVIGIGAAVFAAAWVLVSQASTVSPDTDPEVVVSAQHDTQTQALNSLAEDRVHAVEIAKYNKLYEDHGAHTNDERNAYLAGLTSAEKSSIAWNIAGAIEDMKRTTGVSDGTYAGTYEQEYAVLDTMVAKAISAPYAAASADTSTVASADTSTSAPASADASTSASFGAGLVGAAAGSALGAFVPIIGPVVGGTLGAGVAQMSVDGV